jgi:hypothetical protein|tara:strand:- start:251 stop:436 length:186 start_codon:yes stop_codon:yes gene_type:complete
VVLTKLSKARDLLLNGNILSIPSTKESTEPVKKPKAIKKRKRLENLIFQLMPNGMFTICAV